MKLRIYLEITVCVNFFVTYWNRFKKYAFGAEGRSWDKLNDNNKLLKIKRVFLTLNEFLYSLGCIIAYFCI